MKSATIALVIRHQDSPAEAPSTPEAASLVDYSLLDILSDDREIDVLEAAIQDSGQKGEASPLEIVYAYRQKIRKEEEEFGEYIEELLSQPFLRPEIQEHGLQWLKSKIRIEQFQKAEADAAKVIAEYAYQIFQDDPSRTDFILSGPSTMVRIRVFFVKEEKLAQAA